MAKFFMDGKVYDTEQAEKVFASRGYGFMFDVALHLKSEKIAFKIRKNQSV